MIEKLTKDQEIELQNIIQYWLQKGRSVEPINHEKSSSSIEAMYKAIGKEKPIFLFFSSPMMCILAWAITKEILKNSGSQLRSQLDSQLWSQLSNYCTGSQWCYWEQFFDFCNKIGVVYTVEQRANLNLWIEQSEQCHWWFPYEGIVLVSERPIKLLIDDRGRLHSQNSMSIEYSDGWGIYNWHGISVPEKAILTPDKITIDDIINEKNTEVRRSLIEIIGKERFLFESKAEEIHRDEYGILYSKKLDDEDEWVAVMVTNTTPEFNGKDKEYLQQVHPEIRPILGINQFGNPQERTALNAIASTFGLRGEEYILEDGVY